MTRRSDDRADDRDERRGQHFELCGQRPGHHIDRVAAARVEGARVEREACALIADGEAHTFAAQRIAAAIRARVAGGEG